MRRFRRLVKQTLVRLRLLGVGRRILRLANAGPEASEDHGHALLVELLPGLDSLSAGSGFLVEVGSTREKLHGQGSTVVLATLASGLGIPFVTVDMDPLNTAQALHDLNGIAGATAVTAKGEDFLASFGDPIVAVYLDAFDIQHGRHSTYRVERYRTLLDTEISDRAAAEMHRACAEALLPRMVHGGLVVIDDTTSHDGSFGGKGATAVPFLLSHGFRIVRSTPTSIALQAIGRDA